MKTPKFLQDLLKSNNYWDKNSDEFIKANEYLEKLFPGQLKVDATGQYIEPAYDMTYEQFLTAQKKLDEEIENAVQITEEDNNNNIDFTQFIEIEEKIDVRVLMDWGDIEDKQLIVYTLNIPEEPIVVPNKTHTIWIWRNGMSKNTCEVCAELNGEIFENEDVISMLPVHLNCGCYIEEVEIDDEGKIISSKVYKGQKPYISKEKLETQPENMPTFEKTVDIKPGQYAKFDGKTLTVYQNETPIALWNAVSGKEGFQSPEYQNLKDKGTIPSGTYVARRSELQFYKNISWSDRYRSSIGLGTWRGGTNSWGNSRVWLEPSKETNTYGRSGFSIHGGVEPGSAGCIDLTSQMDAFTKWFENNGHDLIVNIEY